MAADDARTDAAGGQAAAYGDYGVPRPRLLDLFCCSGMAAEGYAASGFSVYGIDIADQPNYPFWFYRWDAIKLMRRWQESAWLHGFDAIHASPPCQHYSDLARRNGNADEWPDLVPMVRDLLEATCLPYVIENVEGALLRDPVMLCGTMFPGLRVIRHRLFETNWQLTAPEHRTPHPLVFTHDKRKAHYGKLDQDTSFVQVTGGGNCSIRNARLAMGLPEDDRRTKHELNEGIPPAYTEWIGRQLMAEVLTRREAVAA